VERALNWLETRQQIEQQKSTKGRIISICNWTKFQSPNSEANNERTTSEQQNPLNPNNERTLYKKERKNISKNERSTPKAPTDVFAELPPGWQTSVVHQAFEDWFEYKKEKGQKYKPRGLKGFITKTLKDFTPNSFIAAVEHSIAQNYSGLFPPSSNGRKPQQQSFLNKAQQNQKILDDAMSKLNQGENHDETGDSNTFEADCRTVE